MMSLLFTHCFKPTFTLKSFLKTQPKLALLVPQCNSLGSFTTFTTSYMLKLCNKSHIVSSSRSKLSEIATEDKYSKEGLQKELIPKHIAFMMDGNRRWLKERGKPLDYTLFFQINALLADLCLKWGVAYATTFIYSYDNLQRGQAANNLIFQQLEKFLMDNLDSFLRKNVKVLMIGEREELPKSLQDTTKMVEEITARAQKVDLVFRLAVCYAGTRDILQATRRLCEKAKVGLIEPSAIDDATFDRELMAGGVPAPELLIRVGGELRLSNYLVWHLALAEFYFLPIYGPEFTEVHFLDALRSFQQRETRRGK